LLGVRDQGSGAAHARARFRWLSPIIRQVRISNDRRPEACFEHWNTRISYFGIHIEYVPAPAPEFEDEDDGEQLEEWVGGEGP